MGNTKKRLAVFLSILFILPSILAVLPQTSEEVLARNSIWMNLLIGTSLYDNLDDEEASLTVEAGQQFYIGDYAWVSSVDKWGDCHNLGTASMVKASYVSSNKDVAAVSGKGLVSTKTEGTANIKIIYRGAKVIFKLHVVPAGSFGEKEAYTKVKKALAKLMKAMPSKVTSKKENTVWVIGVIGHRERNFM